MTVALRSHCPMTPGIASFAALIGAICNRVCALHKHTDVPHSSRVDFAYAVWEAAGPGSPERSTEVAEW